MKLLRLIYGSQKYHSGDILNARIELYYDPIYDTFGYKESREKSCHVTIKYASLSIFGWMYTIEESSQVIIRQKLLKPID